MLLAINKPINTTILAYEMVADNVALGGRKTLQAEEELKLEKFGHCFGLTKVYYPSTGRSIDNTDFTKKLLALEEYRTFWVEYLTAKEYLTAASIPVGSFFKDKKGRGCTVIQNGKMKYLLNNQTYYVVDPFDIEGLVQVEATSL